MQPEYVITRATPEHLAAVADIELAAATRFHGWEVPPEVFVEATPIAALERAQAAGHLWVGLAPTGECVGFAIVERSGERLHLEEIDVLPEHSGRGLGRALLGAIERWASESGVVELTLTTYRDVPWNAPFYMRLGFAIIEPAELDADLSARRAAEIERGLDSMPRVAMSKRLGRHESASPFQREPMLGPDPTCKHPMAGFPRVCFIKNTVTNPNILIGDYTYYDDPVNSEDFERNVLYLYPFVGDKLIIGKYCALATGVRFIMNGANHKMSGVSTYPFSIFGNGWERVQPTLDDLPMKGDTVVGNDVWIGYESLIMPGVRIGDGAVIAARSVVTANVEPYTIVGGNPARPIQRRFSEEVIELFLKVAWWDRDREWIADNLEAITGDDVDALMRAAGDG